MRVFIILLTVLVSVATLLCAFAALHFWFVAACYDVADCADRDSARFVLTSWTVLLTLGSAALALVATKG